MPQKIKEAEECLKTGRFLAAVRICEEILKSRSLTFPERMQTLKALGMAYLKRANLKKKNGTKP